MELGTILLVDRARFPPCLLHTCRLLLPFAIIVTNLASLFPLNFPILKISNQNHFVISAHNSTEVPQTALSFCYFPGATFFWKKNFFPTSFQNLFFEGLTLDALPFIETKRTLCICVIKNMIYRLI